MDVFVGNMLVFVGYMDVFVGNMLVLVRYMDVFVGNMLVFVGYMDVFVGNMLVFVRYIDVFVGNMLVFVRYMDVFVFYYPVSCFIPFRGQGVRFVSLYIPLFSGAGRQYSAVCRSVCSDKRYVHAEL